VGFTGYQQQGSHKLRKPLRGCERIPRMVNVEGPTMGKTLAIVPSAFAHASAPAEQSSCCVFTSIVDIKH
jgi:hypothetical protein